MGKKNKKEKDQQAMLAEINAFLDGDVTNVPEFDTNEVVDTTEERPSILGAFKSCDEYPMSDINIPDDYPEFTDISDVQGVASVYSQKKYTARTEQNDKYQVTIAFDKLVLTIKDSHKSVSLDLNGYCERMSDIVSVDELDDVDDDDSSIIADLLVEVILPRMYPQYVWNLNKMKGRIMSVSEGRPITHFVGISDDNGLGYIITDESINAFILAYMYARYYIGVEAFRDKLTSLMLMYPVEAIIQYAARHGNEKLVPGCGDFLRDITAITVNSITNDEADGNEFDFDLYDHFNDGNEEEDDILPEADYSVDEDVVDAEEKPYTPPTIQEIIDNTEEVEPETFKQIELEEEQGEPVPTVTINGVPVSEYEEPAEDETTDIFADDEDDESFAPVDKAEKVAIKKPKKEEDSSDESFVVKRRV